jgi:hypothetical protein
MVLLANTPEDAPSLTRMAVPGSGGAESVDPHLREWSARHNVPVDAVQPGEVLPAFDAALKYLSTQTGRMTAVSAAKMMDYPVGELRLADHSGSRIPLLLTLGLGMTACAAASPAAARRLRRLSPPRSRFIARELTTRGRPVPLGRTRRRASGPPPVLHQ